MIAAHEKDSHHKAALGGSLAFHAALLGLIFALSNREVIRPFSGTAPITVELVTLAQMQAEEKPSSHEPSPPAPPKPKESPLKKQTSLSAPKPAKPETDAVASSKPQQSWSQAQSDATAATIIYQPMPKIPDDLRREAFNTYAMARFHIAADGTSTVELLEPSQNPRLNHILLETLKTWRFTPASDGGNPIASSFDIRVRFAVE